MKTLKLSLNVTWFKVMRMGLRDVDYRPITPYYCARLCADYDAKSTWCMNCKKNYCWPKAKPSNILFTLGRPFDDDLERIIPKKVTEIRKGMGNQFKGAPSGKCFIIEVE